MHLTDSVLDKKNFKFLLILSIFHKSIVLVELYLNLFIIFNILINFVFLILFISSSYKKLKHEKNKIHLCMKFVTFMWFFFLKIAIKAFQTEKKSGITPSLFFKEVL